ncbi:5-methylthioadenosine/S-adenosylhomocysteine deaminase [Caldalkalibacillus uzonensis]|uniref:5-methylthioadenosine/S-adenosylhomocysteine deaminase n=1 Tax=Caldalkalibacillus uzonensis TaxID=353224 RepID=A0ABU0CQ21_9BACI|nr:amidohydrolase [Caldalkalibacillus uzonensis]MDQ0337620.1 5-methylthioadenosine/S-adenosylhomocysteine deaminase [Caldalkalibacillus uzonensis]
MKTLFKNGVIITANEQNEWFREGYLLVEGKTITAVGSGQPDTESEAEADQVINLKGQWLMPGWVNTHGHAAMSVLRGYADDAPLKEWLEEKMWPMEARFTADTVRWGTALAVVEMLKSGTTCFVDMYDHMDTVAEVVEEAGIRGVLARGIIGLCPEEEQKAKLNEATAFAQRWHQQAGGRITTMMSPHAPYTCPPAYIHRIVERAQQLDLPVHIHLSETAKEVRQNIRHYGQRPVPHLRDIGVFERPTLVAHAVHLEEEEMDILQEYDVKISHNPASNLKLGSGIAQVPRLLERGFRLSIGTDSAASNNNLDMFQEVRLAALIHKGVHQEPTVVPAEAALKMGTKWGAECAFVPHVGSLEKGKEADFIIINPGQAHLQPVHDPVSHIIYAASGSDVRHVYVQGKQVVKDGRCITLDEEKVIYEANRVWRELSRN